MGKVVSLSGRPRADDGPLEGPDLPHASTMRCPDCGGMARLKSTRRDAFDDKYEMWTYACPDCWQESTARVEK